MTLWLGPGRGYGPARAGSEEWKRFKAARSHPHLPWGGIPRPQPPPRSWPSPIPQGLPGGQSWNPQKPNPRVTSKWLPGCSPLSSALTTVISRPQLPQARRLPEPLQGASAQALPVLQPLVPSTCPPQGQSQLTMEGFHLTPWLAHSPPPPQGFSAPPCGLSPLGSRRSWASSHPSTQIHIPLTI